MKKSVFYGVAIVSVLVSCTCLLISAVHGHLGEFLGMLIASLAISTLMLVIEEGWSFEALIWLPIGLALFVLASGVIVTGIDALGINPFADDNFDTVVALGIRWASLIWPMAVLAIGAKHYYDKSQKEKPKKEKEELKEEE